MLVVSINVIRGVDNKNTINKLEQNYLNKDDLDKRLISKIEEKISKDSFRESDKFFLQGYISLKVDNNYDLAQKYFKMSINSVDKYTSDFAKIYSYKFLADIELEDDDVLRGLEYLDRAFKNISPKRYHKDYKSMWDVIYPIAKIDNTLALEYVESVLEYKDKLDDEGKKYLYKFISTLYVRDSNYIEAVEYYLEIIDLSMKSNDYYSAAKSYIDIGIIFRQAGAYELAKDIISDIDDVKIDDINIKSGLNIYKLINLAEINIILKEYGEAFKNLAEIKQYENYINEDILKEVECIKNIAMAQIYLNNDKVSLAENHLNKALDTLQKEERSYYVDKKVYYDIVYGQLEKVKGNYIEAINSFENGIENLIYTKNYEFYEICVNELMNLYIITKDEKSLKYSDELLRFRHERNEIISSEYYSYIVDKYNYMNFVQEKNNMITKYVVIFIILIIISIFIFIREIYPFIKRVKLKNKVKKHLSKNEYNLFYQPIVEPKKDEIIGFEALLRLKIKDTIVMPSKIIKEIEDSRMMKELCIWILNKLIEDYDYIRQSNKNISKFYLSMNISLNEIEDNDMVDKLKNIYENSNLEKQAICLEITENIGGKDFNKIKNNINTLRECGFMIAIDDFGVDYSNMSLIDKFEFDILKLDKYFIDNLDTSQVCTNMIEVFESLSKKMNISVVIEGVETIIQKDFIKCLPSERFYIQGYYYSKPMEIDMIREYKINR